MRAMLCRTSGGQRSGGSAMREQSVVSHLKAKNRQARGHRQQIRALQRGIAQRDQAIRFLQTGLKVARTLITLLKERHNDPR